MSDQQVQKQPTTAYAFSLLGGIIGLVLSLFALLGGLIEGEYDGIFILIIWMLIASLLIIVFARKLKSNPMEHSKWGTLILVFSIASIFGLFAIIGGILALIYHPNPKPAIQPFGQGHPPPQAYPPQPQPQYYPSQQQAPMQYAPQAITKEKETIIKEVILTPCKYCGALSPQLSTFCPNCGAKKS